MIQVGLRWISQGPASGSPPLKCCYFAGRINVVNSSLTLQMWSVIPAAMMANKTLKSHAALAKSLTKRERTQSNHCFMAIYAAGRLEGLRIKRRLNPFALRARLYLKAIRYAFDELTLKAAYHQLRTDVTRLSGVGAPCASSEVGNNDRYSLRAEGTTPLRSSAFIGGYPIVRNVTSQFSPSQPRVHRAPPPEQFPHVLALLVVVVAAIGADPLERFVN